MANEICENCFRKKADREMFTDDEGACQDCGMGINADDLTNIIETHEKIMDGMGSREDQLEMIQYFREKNGREPTFKDERDFFSVYLNMKKSGAI